MGLSSLPDPATFAATSVPPLAGRAGSTYVTVHHPLECTWLASHGGS